jgi:hypothetical protein
MAELSAEGLLVERLRNAARQESRIARQMAEGKSLRNSDGERSDLYSWPEPEQTDSWKAADLIAAFRNEPTAALDGGTLEACAKVAERFSNWDYVQITEGGEWEPGSPYDRGQQAAAKKIAATIRGLVSAGGEGHG